VSEKTLMGVPLAAIRRPVDGERVTYMPGTPEAPAEPIEFPESEARRLASLNPPALRIVPATQAATSARSAVPPAKPSTRAELEARAEMWVQDEPSIEFIMTQSAPLMVPLRPNATVSAVVTA
jgi:hypothetical protein